MMTKESRDKRRAMVEKGYAAVIQQPLNPPNGDDIKFAILTIAYNTNVMKMRSVPMSVNAADAIIDKTIKIQREIVRLCNFHDYTVRP